MVVLQYLSKSSREVLPCVFLLLPSKTGIVYEQFFTTACNGVRNNNGNDPDGFLSTVKQLQLMLFEMFYRRQIYLVVSSIFHRTYGSISNVLDYKNVTWTNHNLVYSYVWLLLLTIIPRRAPLFPSVCGACSIELLKSFHEQIIISRLGKIIPSKCFIHSSNVLEVFRCSTKRRTHCANKNASKPSRICTGTTKMQIRWLQCTYFNNCWRLSEPASYGLSTTHCS